MGKRKADDKTASKDKMDIDGEDSGSDDDMSILNVDFEWFSPDPQIDFHGLKTLLKQLFDVDNQLVELSELTDLILSQPNLGSTIKCDGKESDPYAFISALPLQAHAQKPAVQQLTKYLLSRASGKPQLAQLEQLLSPGSKARVGLVLTERFINMPHQVVPPLYSMLQNELQTLAQQDPNFDFTHYLFLSKAYTEVASELEVEDTRPSKKSKSKISATSELFFFHPEDEVLQNHALGFAGFEYQKQGDEGASDAKRAFQELGVRPQGLLMLVESGKFDGMVKAVAEYLGAAS